MKRLLLFVLCGLPLVAQDPVREWNGAGYSEETAQNFWNDIVVTKAHDALLFVDNTTAARKNPR